VQRSKRFVAMVAIAALLGGSIAWTVALWIAPLGAYEVALQMDDGRFAIVLDRRAPTDRAPRLDDPAMNDGDGLHDEYVVTVATLDAYSTADSGKSAKTTALAVILTCIVDVTHVALSIPCAVSSSAGPPRPASFSILRV
jgi:hypothetical protein